MEYRYGSHTVFQIEYHFVWVTKYRYQVLKGEVAERVRELVRQTCEAFEIRIIRGVVSKDHVHMMCQHFSGHMFKQLFAAIHSLQATNSHWRNEVARGCKTLRYIRTLPV